MVERSRNDRRSVSGGLRGVRRAVLVHGVPVVAAVAATALVTVALQPVAPLAGPSGPVLDRSWAPSAYRGTLSEAVAALVAPLERLLGMPASPDTPWRAPGTVVDGPVAHAAAVDYTAGAGVVPAVTTAAAASAGQGLIPWETFDNLSLTTDTSAIVDQGNGNLILKSTDGCWTRSECR